VVAALVISIFQWLKIGDNDKTTEKSLEAIRETANATARIAEQMKASSAIMEKQLAVMQTTSAARVAVAFEPFTPGDDTLKVRLRNEGATVAREMAVMSTPEWFGESPMALAAMNPRPPFTIEAGQEIAYSLELPMLGDGKGKTWRDMSVIPKGYDLRVWYRAHWINAFGNNDSTMGCFRWVNRRSWDRCEPPKPIDWVRVYRQNGLSEEAAREAAATHTEDENRRSRDALLRTIK
jgi:hypothetical protein